MNPEVVSFGHNDLDQLGCMLNIHEAMPNTSIKFFHTNYRNIDEIVHDTEEYIKQQNVKLLLITDVSFAQHPHLLHRLVDLGVKTVYIDHHVYPENFFDDFDMTVSYHAEKSATLLTHEFFNNRGKNKRLDMITDIIDTYDLWRVKDPKFSISNDLNDYFWHVGLDWLYTMMVNGEYKLPNNYSGIINSHKAKKDNFITKAREKKLIHTDGAISIAFVDEYFNDILLEEFDKGVKAVIIANSYGIIRVRFNQYSSLKSDSKRIIKEKILGTCNTGHVNAFSFKLESVSFDNIMTEIERVTGVITKYV